MIAAVQPAGILFPESLLASSWFGVFAAFVAINTVIYVLLSVSKLFPVIRFGRRRDGQSRRIETRGIYPEGFARYSRANEAEPGPGQEPDGSDAGGADASGGSAA